MWPLQETYFTLNGTSDMFWVRPMDMEAINQHCEAKYGVRPRATWIATEFEAFKGRTLTLTSTYSLTQSQP